MIKLTGLQGRNKSQSSIRNANLLLSTLSLRMRSMKRNHKNRYKLLMEH